MRYYVTISVDRANRLALALRSQIISDSNIKALLQKNYNLSNENLYDAIEYIQERVSTMYSDSDFFPFWNTIKEESFSYRKIIGESWRKAVRLVIQYDLPISEITLVERIIQEEIKGFDYNRSIPLPDDRLYREELERKLRLTEDQLIILFQKKEMPTADSPLKEQIEALDEQLKLEGVDAEKIAEKLIEAIVKADSRAQLNKETIKLAVEILKKAAEKSGFFGLVHKEILPLVNKVNKKLKITEIQEMIKSVVRHWIKKNETDQAFEKQVDKSNSESLKRLEDYSLLFWLVGFAALDKVPPIDDSIPNDKVPDFDVHADPPGGSGEEGFGGDWGGGADSPLIMKAAFPSQTEKPKVVGGIDFRQMNLLIQPQGSLASSSLDFSLPMLSRAELESFDLDKELTAIQRMASSGIAPNPERFKEYLAVCFVRGRTGKEIDGLKSCLEDVFEQQQFEAKETPDGYKEVLVVADTRRYVLKEGRFTASRQNSYSLN